MTNTSNDTFTEPIIFHKMNQLYLVAHERTIKFPKPTRYSLGTRIENTVLELIELFYLAQSKKGASRLLILNKADITLKMLTTHLRLAYKTKSINDAGFASLSEQVIEIGKMTGGWIKSTKTPPRRRGTLRENETPRLSLRLSGLFLFTFAPVSSKLPTFTRLPSDSRLVLSTIVRGFAPASFEKEA